MGQQRAEVEESAAAVARGRSSRGGPRSAGRVLSDMEKADAAKALRLQKLRAEVEEGERLHETFTPVLVARPESARSAAARSSAGPAHERLYALRPSTAGGASIAGRDGNVGNVHRTPRTAAAGVRPLPSRAAGEPASAPVAEDLYRDAEVGQARGLKHYKGLIKVSDPPKPVAECVVCGDSIVLKCAATQSLTLLMEQMGEDARLQLTSPSISVAGGSKLGTDAIYMRGTLEPHYAPNLDKPVSELFASGATLIVTNPGMPNPVKVVVEYEVEYGNLE